LPELKNDEQRDHWEIRIFSDKICGASFDQPGARYREMRNVKALMTAERFSGIPAELRKMKRLWTSPSVRGVALRREQEARLFEQGLGAIKAAA
jgi:hypothetical protein